MFGSYCGGIFYLQHYYDVHINQLVGVPSGYRPYVVGTLQFLATFLAGFGLNEASSRFKAALTAVLAFQESVETLRSLLVSSTEDPKFRFAVQVFITWLVVLMRKTITFYSEDFSRPVGELIPIQFQDCVVFLPEVLWAFDRARAEFVFDEFLKNSRMDHNRRVDDIFHKAMTAFNSVTELLVVRSPNAKQLLTKLAVQLFLLVIPLVNEDVLTLALLPPVAAMFNAIVQLSGELADPWGDDDHDLPLREVMGVLSTPVWYDGDEEKAEESLRWLNKGLTENSWLHPGNETPRGVGNMIPRKKVRGDGAGMQVDFQDWRTLSEIAHGHTNWERFLSEKAKDMDQAKHRGRRMPDYLRGEQVLVPTCG